MKIFNMRRNKSGPLCEIQIPMNTGNLLLIALLSLWVGSDLLSQNAIQPPQPLCLRGDTLNWTLPVNTCGTFNAYEIYRATSEAGPYSLIATISDELQTEYIDPNPLSELRFYYMLSDYNCPSGWAAIPSDTISNAFPDDIAMQFVTVQGGNVLVQWAPGNDSQTYAYLVYREINGNVDLIDTVFNALQYLDTGADPQSGSELYYVLALDACGNTSAFVSPHHTLFLEVEQDYCLREMGLSWNAYENWPEGTETYRIWVSRDGAAYEAVADLPEGSLTYTYEDLTNGSDYCFYVEAIAKNAAFSSASNVVCLSANTAPVPAQLALLNAGVSADGQIEIAWQWDDSLTYSSANLGWLNGDVIELLPLDTTPPLQFQNTYIHQQSKYKNGPQEYSLHVSNECGEEFFGGKATTVYLRATALSDGVQLEWTPFELTQATVTAYRLYTLEDGQLQLLQQFNSGALDFKDNLPSNFNLRCYQVEALFQRLLPDGSVYEGSSFSNTACAEPQVRIYMPNAFAPEGTNDRYLPGLPATNFLADYRLQIWDRYGSLLFETGDPSEGWDGSYRSRPMPMGTYVYYLRLITLEGEVVEKKGALVLVR